MIKDKLRGKLLWLQYQVEELDNDQDMYLKKQRIRLLCQIEHVKLQMQHRDRQLKDYIDNV